MRAALLAVLVAGLTAGCAPTASTVSVSGSAASGDVAASTGCARAGSGVPDGAGRRPTIDVDGDGRTDTAWITGTRFGVTTASGDTTSVQVDVAGAAGARGLVARVGGSGPVLAFVAGSRDAQLFRFTGCALKAVTNPDGDQWRFDLSGAHGTGVGCQDADGDGKDDLNGLLLPASANDVATGTYVKVARTIIRISGTKAVGGPTDTVEARTGTSAIENATTVTCGDLTLRDDGVAPTTASSTSTSGCPANDVAVPKGATTATIADVDGDGKPDSEFYAETSQRTEYGIRTASGRTVLLPDDLAGPATHHGWATGPFETSPPLAVLDDGRTATLHAFVGCRFVTTTDVKGAPYRFGLYGFSEYGTGVECIGGGTRGGLVLEGVNTVRRSDGRYAITSTEIDVSKDGRTAKAGAKHASGTTYAASSPTVARAKVSTCEDVPIVRTGGR